MSFDEYELLLNKIKAKDCKPCEKLVEEFKSTKNRLQTHENQLRYLKTEQMKENIRKEIEEKWKPKVEEKKKELKEKCPDSNVIDW